jgi:AcrR family transcriptional regulator
LRKEGATVATTPGTPAGDGPTTRQAGPASSRRPRYHHGELRTALIEATFELLREVGLTGFSVAELARRLGVSTAAPYRHFAHRDELLAAVATRAARELTTAMRTAADAAPADPVERFAATAGAYVTFVTDRGAGLDIIFAAELRHLHDRDLADAGRELNNLLLDLAVQAVNGGPAQALLLIESHIAIAQGYSTLNANGFLEQGRHTTGAVAERASRASAALVRGQR